jgi:hypothetical protein
MVKLALRTAAIIVAMSTSALAESQSWNITEEGESSIKSAQGTWAITIDANKKISGSATMQMMNGNDLSYSLDGSLSDAVYTVNMSKRTDGKSGCVWTGHSPASADGKSHGLIGKVLCDGKVGFTVRAGF